MDMVVQRPDGTFWLRDNDDDDDEYALALKACILNTGSQFCQNY